MNIARRSWKVLAIRTSVLVAMVCLALVRCALADVPAGFQDTTIATGLSEPAGLAFAPDGRLFVTEKTGALRVVKEGGLVATPFLDITQVLQPPLAFDDFLERGLLGVAFDPGFPASPYVYVYYTVCKVPGSGSCQTAKNRVARFTAGYQGNPDIADPTSEVILLDDIDSDAGSHNGGWIGFGPLDGKLYVAIGDGGSIHTKSQDPGSLNGKILRLDPDGTVPADNPFVGLFGARPEVYALGFRNPWRCRFHPGGRFFCGDVGENSWEEIDWVVAGGNYGWPNTEGDFDPAQYPQFTRPIFTYSHNSVGGSAAITGGDFGSQTSFPGTYQQSYFFGDYVVGFIRQAVLATDGVTVQSAGDFATNLQGNTDLVAGPDGALYYPDIIGGEVHRIAAIGSNIPPVARATATPSQGPPPLTVQFSSAGSSSSPSITGAQTIWPSTTVPEVVDVGPDDPVELGVKFSSDVAGFITGIRFYKSAANTGTHVGNLWSSTGTRLATATFTDESASGWQQVSFATPVAIEANTVYVASYFCPNGHYSGELNYFAAQGVDSPPLHALADGVSGGDGVFAYGDASTFPNLTFFASSYFVDVVFGTIDADSGALSVLWDFGDGSPTSTDADPVHTYATLGAYTAVLTVSDGRAPTPGTDTVSLPIIVGIPPVVTISAPQIGSHFQGGQTIAIAGSATDAQDGPLPTSALHWEIRFQHDTHYHPYVHELVGSPQSFDTQTTGETSANVWYRVILRATDSAGLTGEAFVDVLPETATFRLDTSPPGLALTLDGQPITAPIDVTGVVGVIRTLGAPSPQGANTFDQWSDGGVQVHTISTPSSDTTYTAIFDGPSPTTSTSTSTSSTSVPPTTSTTTLPPSSTSTSVQTSSTSSSSTTGPSTSTTSSTAAAPTSTTSSTVEPLPTSTTSTTLPACSPAFTREAVGCRIDQLATHVSDASSALGRAAPGLERRIARASLLVQRAGMLCEEHRLSRARAALRGAVHQLNAAFKQVRNRSTRELIPPELGSQLQQLVKSAVGDVKTLHDGLACP